MKKYTCGSGLQTSLAIIKCSNGKVYAAGYNLYGSFGIGTTSSTSKFIEISKENEIWSKAKIIYNPSIISYVITEDGELYGAGYNAYGQLGLGHTNTRVTTLTKISDNVKNMSFYNSSLIFLKNDGYLYMTDRNGNINKLNGIQSEDIQFLSNSVILLNKKMYLISTSGTISSYHSNYDVNEYMYFGGNTKGFISNNKIYIDGVPNITKPKEKSIYNLRNVFSGVQYVQGGTNLNIVDNDGNVYEGIKNKITSVSDIKQIAASNSTKFLLGNNGQLYAKGTAYLWGNELYKSDYTKVTKDGTEEFNNVDKIFAVNEGYGLIFTTTNNEIYWAGTTSFVAIPKIEGDRPTIGMRKCNNLRKKSRK